VAQKKSVSSVSMITKIKKRDGRVADFNKSKITDAIFKAARVVGGKDKELAAKLADKVLEVLEKKLTKNSIPTVEQVQDIVEKVLIEEGHAKTAKAYILYREHRAALRKEKAAVLEKDEIDDVDKRFDVNALRVLKARYLRKDESGKLIETPKELFTRIAVHTTIPELFYDASVFNANGGEAKHPQESFDQAANDGKFSIGSYKLNRYHLEAVKRLYDRFNREGKMKVDFGEFLKLLKSGAFEKYEKNVEEYFNLMAYKRFLPNTPAIANFGAMLGMGSACFVLGINDSMESIMKTLTDAAFIFKAGGGVGYNFSNLRHEGDFVKSTCGIASGPITFITLFDKMTEVIKQGGIRRGANMGIINSNHPDIEKFITAKEGNKQLRNFNISILMMSDFWKYYDANEPYPLVSPRTGEIVRYVNPRMLFDRVVYQAWESAEPGVIFFDKVNKYNPFFEHLGPIVTTNPCVSADTLIPTENGLERIDSVTTENIVVDARTIENPVDRQILLQKGTLIKSLQVVKTGIKKVYKIETRSGYELEATPDHKILTGRGWVPLAELTEEDKIFIQSGEGRFREDVNLPFEIQNSIKGENGRTYKFNLPTKWSFDLGMALGWLVGDGFINKEYNTVGLVFAPEDSEAKSRIKPLLETYFNREISEVKYENGCVQLRSNSRHITDFFLRLGYNPNGREVPKSIFTASKEAVLGFLTGLFSSDGTISIGSKSRNYIRLNSSSLKLLKQTQLLLLNFGVRTSIYDRSTKPKVFTYQTKAGVLKEYQTSGKNYELNISKKNLEKFIELIGFIQTKNKGKIESLKTFEFYQENFTDSLASREYMGKKEVWDVTEPLTHSFIGNGIVVHNCGEVLLYPNESCNLGSINVWAFAKEDDDGNVYFDWGELAETVRVASRFLDNVIDVNKYPLQAIEDMTLATRKIGLGVMGVGDLLFELRLPYNTEDGRRFMEKLMEFINYHSKLESIELVKTRGNLPYYDKSFYPKGTLPFAGFEDKNSWSFDWDKVAEAVKKHGVRNGFTTVIAPTGSISMIAGTSSGIEPVYSLAFEKNVKVGSFYYTDPVFEKVMKREGLYDEKLMEEVVKNSGTIQNISYIPPKLKKVFVTATTITPEEHIRVLACFQKWTDSSISKTNNFPADATVEDMRASYILAYKLGCKGVTVFRDGSIKDQVLVSGEAKKSKAEPGTTSIKTKPEETKHEPFAEQPIPVEVGQSTPNVSAGLGVTLPNTGATFTSTLSLPAESKQQLKNCPECEKDLVMKEGCVSCQECGWGLCK